MSWPPEEAMAAAADIAELCIKAGLAWREVTAAIKRAFPGAGPFLVLGAKSLADERIAQLWASATVDYWGAA